MSIISLDKEYVAGTYGRFPVELVSGKGSVVTDANGKTYIDERAINKFRSVVFPLPEGPIIAVILPLGNDRE